MTPNQGWHIAFRSFQTIGDLLSSKRLYTLVEDTLFCPTGLSEDPTPKNRRE
ncbi:hypothetical protein M407DRAFT_17516 [Tulasnella calospora MUT 4182]|uniref:Uncharacterized protein n=1 Tax=Tulasnella calospora MUT 4182 TaxID=1051891 RepID=A0A0C3QLE5_9AGAM|nr:hypothetical protein M407DRAFT_17516 [Tulasnella calospora MUT 4182]